LEQILFYPCRSVIFYENSCSSSLSPSPCFSIRSDLCVIASDALNPLKLAEGVPSHADQIGFMNFLFRNSSSRLIRRLRKSLFLCLVCQVQISKEFSPRPVPQEFALFFSPLSPALVEASLSADRESATLQPETMDSRSSQTALFKTVNPFPIGNKARAVICHPRYPP